MMSINVAEPFGDLLERAAAQVKAKVLVIVGKEDHAVRPGPAIEVLEGVKDSIYRTVIRQCPDLDRRSAEEAQFAKAGQLLFEIAGHKWDGDFDLHCTNPRPYFSQGGDPSCPTCLSGP